MKTCETIYNILKYSWKERSSKIFLSLIFLCNVIFKLLVLYVPYIYGKMIDYINTTSPSAFVLPIGLILGYAIARLLSNIFQFIQEAVLPRVSERVARLIAIEIFDHLHKLSHDFYLRQKSGGVTQTIRLGIRSISVIMHILLLGFVPVIMEYVLVCIFLFFIINFYFMIFLITLSLFFLFGAAYLSGKFEEAARRINEAEVETNSLLIESLLNFESVKYFGKRIYEKKLFEKAWRNQEELSIKAATRFATVRIVQEWLLSIISIIFLLGAFYQMILKNITVGQLVMLMMYITELLYSIQIILQQQNEIRRCLVDMEGIFNLLKEKPTILDKPNASPIKIDLGKIEFKNVCFSYDTKKDIFKHISFLIPPQKITAILGRTGVGKTTIFRLLLRLYDITEGQILIDQQDVRNVQQENLRESIGIVPQDISLFNNTIAFNIAYANPKATQAQIEEAARLAQIHNFIEDLPHKYDTVVGERGIKLSGGEKQRIALARAWLKQPKILLFDEATSALDTDTERKIQQSLHMFKEKCTVIMIAHRLSTVSIADHILFVDSSQKVEQGKHKQLLSINENYKQLWEGSVI